MSLCVMTRLLIISVICSLFAACQLAEKARPHSPAKLALHQDIVTDETRLPENPNIKQIARSLPLMDFPWEGFEANEVVTDNGNAYELGGDGAQSSFRIRKLSDVPLSIEVDFGPHFDGFGRRMPMEHYSFERVNGGWRRTAFNVTYHGSARIDGTYEEPLTEKENRKYIEKITGKPYGYHFRGR